MDQEFTNAPARSCHGRYRASLLGANNFTVTFELVSGRGAVEKSQYAAIAWAEQIAKSGKVTAVSITDNPGGSPALSAAMMAVEIKRLGIEPIVHLTCKDRNRNELESLLYGLERSGICNLLVMTGDYPKAGYSGAPKPVFDLDAVTLLQLISSMNQGLDVPNAKGSTKLSPAHFFSGAVVNPFKTSEAEQMGQYFKLAKKLEAGAQFIVSQVGFDARKFHELLKMLKVLGFGRVPTIGNIYVLSLGAARLMNGGGLPGCGVTKKLLAQLEEEAIAPDKGKSKRLERAAKMYALLKGMGFAGAHISGSVSNCEDLDFILSRGEELSPNWRDFVHVLNYLPKDAWHYFEADAKSGLNSDVIADRSERPHASFEYSAMRALHRTMFDPEGLLFEPLQKLAETIDRSKFKPAFTVFERVMKGMTNGCLQCGDCAMPDLAHLCPQSQCAKNQRNGPCGGSHDGWCEKYAHEKQCFYVRVYERLKGYGEEQSLMTPIAPVDHEQSGTSSWLNFYLGRDHSAKRLGIPKKKRTTGEQKC